MGVRVASIFADVGLDSSKFSKGTKDILGGLSQIFGSFGKFAGVLTIAGTGVGMLVDQVSKATKETQNYNLSMVDLARKMGTTTEEASRLAQVGDDVRLSQEQISTAMTYAIRNGVEPNIEGLAKLADEYNALNTPVEKGQLLLKTFGRSGMEMGKLMEKGSAGIREMSGAIDDNLIVTYEAARASEELYKAQDELSDQWQAIKMQVGNDLIPVLNDYLTAVSDTIEIQKMMTDAQDKGANGNYALEASMTKLYREQQNVTYSTEELTKKFRDVETASIDVSAAYGNTDEELKALNETNQTTIGLIEQFTSMTTLSADEHDKATKKIVLGYMEQKLAADGILDDKETQWLINKGVEWGVYSSTAITAMKAAMTQADMLVQSMNAIPTYKKILIETQYTFSSPSYGNSYSTPSAYTNNKRAYGGSAGGMTLVGERGPELVNLPNGSSVTDANQTKRMLEQDKDKSVQQLQQRYPTASEIGQATAMAFMKYGLAGNQ